MNVHFSSARLDWKTPKAIFDALDAEFHFDHDPTPADNGFDYRRNNGQELMPFFPADHLPKVKDGLNGEWGQSNYCNPPYGSELPKWIKKGHEEWKKGKTIVFLVPSRTDTRWFHDYILGQAEIRFIKGRLKFDEHENSAPFPSAIVIFKAGRKPQP